jgi:tetratricopeptide (TPR) repeat protein
VYRQAEFGEEMIYDCCSLADCLKALWQAPAIAGLTEALIGISEAQRNLSLQRLEDARLLTVNRAEGSGELITLDAHPLLREYFARRVRQQQPEAWRAAHRRLYEHLCATTPDKPDATLEDLQPLYQAVAHGCQAGLHQEAHTKILRERTQRVDEYYSTRKLGAFGAELGALACFFDIPWSQVTTSLPVYEQALVLNQASFRLQALGRLNEALEPTRASIVLVAKQENWEQAGRGAANLSELEMTLGKVAGAIEDAEQSVTYADRSGDAFERMCNRAIQANVLHQAGRRAEAKALFREAEQMQAVDQPEYPLLYSVRCLHYCDLLIAKVERAAWQMRNAECEVRIAELIEVCRTISQRANSALQIVLKGSRTFLSIALNHLTLGRAALYTAILEQSAIQNSQSEINAAVSGLRQAGMQDHIPRGLLTRAWLRGLIGARTDPESAQSDLDEAWEIAERGSMKLFLTDIHLYRARLFFREPSYPWQSPQDDLAAAEKLINDCGYHRRDGELADAKQAILGQALR